MDACDRCTNFGKNILPMLLPSMIEAEKFSDHSRTGSRGSAVAWGTALQAGRSRVRFPMVSLNFFTNIILPAALLPWGRLSLQQKWVPGIFPVCKGGRCVRLTTLPPSCANCFEIGSLNLLEPLGPVQACNGIALPFWGIYVVCLKSKCTEFPMNELVM